MVYGTPIAPDDRAVEKLEQISEFEDVHTTVGLGDLYMGDLEAPTSIAVAAKDAIYPEIGANVINCGMSVIKTDLQRSALTDDAISNFCETLRQTNDRFTPTTSDVRQMVFSGADYVSDRYDLDPDIVERIENRGNMFRDRKPDRLIDIMPPWGTIYRPMLRNDPMPSLGGNHFLELQVVDKVVDEPVANEWELDEGQILIALHGDYRLTSFVNYHHANRLDFRSSASIADKSKLKVSKIIYHLLRDGPLNLRNNLEIFDNAGQFTRIDANSSAGKQFERAYYGAMNYAYANRLLASIVIDETLQETLNGSSELLWDVGHDTIQREQHGGEDYWIHRKGAAKAIPDKPAFIAGSYNMDSLLGRGMANSNKYLNSYDHGSSNVLDHYRKKGKLSKTDACTRCFDFGEAEINDTVRHVTRTPIQEISTRLESHEIVEPVAWLKPVINISA